MAKDRYTQQELEQQIAKGGSVLHDGKLIRTIPALRQAFETPESVEDEIAALEKRKAELEAKRASSRGDWQPSAPPASEAGNDSKSDGLESLTKAELIERAGEVKAEVSEKMTKAEIVEAIRVAAKAPVV